MVYNFGMIKFVYIQVAGIEKPAKIRADQVIERKSTIILKDGEEQVGKFRASTVQGWWIEQIDK